jgi:hypothetical protein
VAWLSVAGGLGHTEQSVLMITGGMEGHTGGTTIVFGTKGPGTDSGGGDMLSILSFDLDNFFETFSEILETVVKNSKPTLFDVLEEDGYWLLIKSVLGKREPEGGAVEEEVEVDEGDGKEAGTPEEEDPPSLLLFSYTNGVLGNHV